MKKNIHPKYTKIKAQCSCNYIIYTRSTLNRNLNLDICSFCHPFYTGTQRTIDTKGRVNSFNKKFNFANNKFTFSKK